MTIACHGAERCYRIWMPFLKELFGMTSCPSNSHICEKLQMEIGRRECILAALDECERQIAKLYDEMMREG